MNNPPLNKGIDLDNPVTCTDCKRSYMCTPYDDYYGATGNDDGHCERCLLIRAGMGKARVVTVAVEPRERPETMGEAVRVHRSSGTVEDDWEVASKKNGIVAVRKWYPLIGEYLIKHLPEEMFDTWQDEWMAEKHPYFVQYWNISKEMDE